MGVRNDSPRCADDGRRERESMKKAYYSYIYKLSLMEQRELKRDLHDLHAGYPVYTKTDKVKNVLYELGVHGRAGTQRRLSYHMLGGGNRGNSIHL